MHRWKIKAILDTFLHRTNSISCFCYRLMRPRRSEDCATSYTCCLAYFAQNWKNMFVAVFISFHFTRTRIFSCTFFFAFVITIFIWKTYFAIWFGAWNQTKMESLFMSKYLPRKSKKKKLHFSSNSLQWARGVVGCNEVSIILELKVEIENKINLMAVQIKCHKFNNFLWFFFSLMLLLLL